MKINHCFITICTLAFLFYACEKEDIPIKQAEAIPSFADLWEFRDAYFSNERDGSIFLRFEHDNPQSSLIDKIRFKNIEPREDSFKLMYVKPGSGLQPGKPTAYYTVLVDEDAIGDQYVIDSSAEKTSIIFLDCVTKNKISGRFYLNFVIYEKDSLGKVAPYIPDTFNISEGRFYAKKLD